METLPTTSHIALAELSQRCDIPAETKVMPDKSNALRSVKSNWSYEELYREYKSMTELCALYIKSNHDKEKALAAMQGINNKLAAEIDSLRNQTRGE